MLQLGRVSAGYGSFQALFEVSLEVDVGEAVAVIGPNGAGKTTLLRVISELIEISGDLARTPGPPCPPRLMQGLRLQSGRPDLPRDQGIRGCAAGR